MAKMVFINREQFNETEFKDMTDILSFLGYDLAFTETMIPTSDIIIDKRTAGFTTYRGALSDITVMHPREMQEWNRLKEEGVDKSVCVVYSSLDDLECAA